MKDKKTAQYLLITVSVVIGFLAIILTHNPVTSTYEYNYEGSERTGWIRVKHNDSTWTEKYDYDSINIRNHR